MINTSSRPLVLVQDVELHRVVELAIDTVMAMLARQFDKHTRKVTPGFNQLLAAGNRKPGARFDEAFVQACFDVSQDSSRNTGNKDARDVMARYLIKGSVSAIGLASLKSGLKRMLVQLWKVRGVLLPTTFTVGSHFPVELFDHRLLSWLRRFDPHDQTDEGGSADARRLCYYGPRLVWTTDWQGPADISLTDLAALNRAALLYRHQQTDEVIAAGGQLPFTLIAAHALTAFPDEVCFSAGELASYSRWLLSGSFKTQTFSEYCAAPPPQASDRRTRSVGSAHSLRQTSTRRVQPILSVDPLAECDVHESLRVKFIALGKAHRTAAEWQRHDLPVYAGREHVSVQSFAPRWIEAMRAYMHQRAHVKEYRSKGEASSALNILADYLFFYLPWWRELAKSPKVEIPRSPRELRRFSFVSRHTTESVEEFPETLLTVIAWRRKSKESIAIAVRQIDLLFRFLTTHFADDEEIAGVDFQSPLDPDFDSPTISRRSKTTKVVIPKNIYGYLLFYAYALEEAGIKLEEAAKSGKLFGNKTEFRAARWLTPESLGIQIHVKYRSSDLPLSKIPNLYQWTWRELRTIHEGGEAGAWIPHCTVLRMLIVSIETGLRVQSVQWLDRRTWRREASDASWDSYTFPLYVNTDKTKKQPWVTQVVHRVRDLLRRQEEFQDLFADADAFAPVAYEGSTIAPFDPIEPLFLSPKSGKPVSDTLYSSIWQHLMVGFEEFYRTATGEQHVRMYKLQPVKTSENLPVVHEDKSGALFCPLSLLAVHTPHACRATFATNRKGILDLSDTAELLGHASIIVTSHYDKPSAEDIAQRLEASDRQQNREFMQFDPGSGVHIRADKPESALVRSFGKDRNATIKTFNFVPGVSLWSTEDGAGGTDGLQLLREGPMSRIRFRETHVCPVGEECPQDILERIGAPKRCGCCPLAMRCVDHLPAISAKRNQLLERIRYLHGRYKALEKQGEPTTVLDDLWEEMELDANEFLGWQLTEEILLDMPVPATDDDIPHLLVERPEFVKQHLSRVSRSSSTAELLLQRIADSNAYPNMETPQVQMAASLIKRRLLAGRAHDPINWENDDGCAVRDVAKMLGVMMKATGLSIEQTVRALHSPSSADAVRLLTVDANGE